MQESRHIVAIYNFKQNQTVYLRNQPVEVEEESETFQNHMLLM